MTQQSFRIAISILIGLVIAVPALADAPPTTQPTGNEVAAVPSTTQPVLDTVKTAQAKLKAVETRIDKEFQDSPDFKTAVDRVNQAQVARDAAKSRVLANLATDPDYQAAAQKRDSAKQALDQARQSNDSTPDQIADLAMQAMTARAAVTKMEDDAMGAEGSEVFVAEKNLATAKETLRQLLQKHRDAIKNDPDWVAAAKELRAARAPLAAASSASAPAVGAPTVSVPVALPNAIDRKIAEAVLQLGGKVTLLEDGNEAPWSALPLPDGGFAVTAISLHNIRSVGDQDVTMLHQATSLKHLDLWATKVGDETVANEIIPLRQLEDLNLAWTTITDKSAVAIGGMTNLTSLDIGGTQISDAGMIPIGRLIHLKSLTIVARTMTDEGLKPLEELRELTYLDANHTNVSGLWAISTLNQLQHLDLHATQLTDDGLRPITSLPNLEWLDVGSGTKITDRGLATIRGLTQLTYLCISGDQVTDRGVRSLSSLTNLQSLVVTDTLVTDAAIHEALPRCQILR